MWIHTIILHYICNQNQYVQGVLPICTTKFFLDPIHTTTFVFSYIQCSRNTFTSDTCTNIPSLHSFHLILPDWLIIYKFYVPLKNISLIWRRHHCRWRAAKFRPMLGAQGLWAGRDLHRATPAVTRDLGFSGLIRRIAPFSRLLRHMRGCGGSILTRILTCCTESCNISNNKTCS